MHFQKIFVLAALATSAMAIPFSPATETDVEVVKQAQDWEIRGHGAPLGVDLDIDADIELGKTMKPTCFGKWVHKHGHKHKVWKPVAYCSVDLHVSLHADSLFCYVWGGCCPKKHHDALKVCAHFKAACKAAGGAFWYV